MTRNELLRRLYQMLEHARDAVDMAATRTQAQLEQERMFALALSRCVIVIGEAAGSIDTDIQARHPQIPWGDMIRMRNRLLEDYEVIDFDALWSTVTADLPPLIQQLERIIAEQEPD